MKIIKPDVQFITPIDGATILKRLEQCGRVCYSPRTKSRKVPLKSSLPGSSSVGMKRFWNIVPSR